MTILNKFQTISYKWFGKFAEKYASDKIKHDLDSIHFNTRGAVYLSIAILVSILVTIISIFVFSLWIFVLLPPLNINLDLLMTIIFVIIIPIILCGITYFIFLIFPGFKAKSRGKKIDKNLAYALNFVSAMSSAGVTPADIFKSLSKQEIYGEVKNEASWIYRDVTLLGADIITALKKNIDRTPSQKFKDFLQGMIVTVTSGGSLKSYFVAKANQFMVENRQNQKQLIESLGIMAESYVTAAVAGVLLLFIVIPVMMVISGDANQISFLWIIIFMVVPLIHIGFAYVVKAMASEG